MSKAGYPIWWEDTITIYNKFEDPQTKLISWYKQVITECFWKLQGSTIKVGDVTLDSKSIICRIPKDSRFLEKQEWVALPNDLKAEHFTIGQADIVLKGAHIEDIDEYTTGHRSTDLLGKYRDFQACMEVTDFSINTGLGKNNEHYLIRGK